ncbi:Rho-binding antiterminator [Pseudoalteromonas rubra]|uniref:Rho-binding antiterminator n=1 Tax=Pseudoalteromonas rubra TaxID=43658 RepID=UPI001F0BDB61|nr:Rho-binding antiterminator [Pseudoalteromonas rubra]
MANLKQEHKRVISCSDYDYFEIVCLFHYPVTINLRSGEQRSGMALDLCRDTHKNECLKLSVGDQASLVQLTQITKLTINTANPHFSEKLFS